jgi:hypothetical protein
MTVATGDHLGQMKNDINNENNWPKVDEDDVDIFFFSVERVGNAPQRVFSSHHHT